VDDLFTEIVSEHGEIGILTYPSPAFPEKVQYAPFVYELQLAVHGLQVPAVQYRPFESGIHSIIGIVVSAADHAGRQ
jgi:hypothetical protein